MKEQTRAQNSLPKLLDLNLLPEQYRRRKLSFRIIRPWLLMLAFAFLLAPTTKILVDANAEVAHLEYELNRAQDALEQFSDVSAEREALVTRLEEALTQAERIEEAYQSVAIQHIDWSEVLNSVVRAVPSGVELTDVTQYADEFVLTGVTDNYLLPLTYADRLRATGLFVSVTLEAVDRLDPVEISDEIEAEPTPQPRFQFEIALGLEEYVETTEGS